MTAADGRVRRRAVFGADALPANGADGYTSSEADDDEEGDEEGSDGGEGGSSSGEEAEEGWGYVAAAARRRRQRDGSDSEEDDEDEDEEDEGLVEEGSDEEDEEGIGAAAAWKANMLERAAALFRWAAAGVGVQAGDLQPVLLATLAGLASAGRLRWLHSGAACPVAATWLHRPPTFLPILPCSTRGADLHSYIYGTRATSDVSP